MNQVQFIRRLIKLIVIGGIFGAALMATQPVLAEGSKDLTNSGGYRPFLLNSNTLTGGIVDKNIFKVYAEVGEVINLGSSANGSGLGVINYRDPIGGAWQQCVIP
ncbi:MAG TPA: hypothetical protein VHL11_21260, partial [Phototrophicaceae bacterium]|nr:hypothetical protein [Phototrophicaceae bacterium]